MATIRATADHSDHAALTAPISFARFGGTCAVLTGIVGLLYAISFVILKEVTPDLGDLLSGLFLLLGALLSTPALTALYARLRTAEPEFALWALLIGLGAAFGVMLHGGYDLANAINTPDALPDLPSQSDPRGLFAFGLTGLSLLAFSWLMRRSRQFPARLPQLGYALAALLAILYLARLIILDASNPVVVIPALLTGFLANPVWYIWLGLQLRREPVA
jgi:hypothetical protein